ncbi:Ldh family oxidoreductase [Paenibacillus eucommiae]|uniref:LDH2 family malate/lactate/ureidoglycolate dehydrogenase n=1 Tax=Paenibacillus eucommiae TaxID=1355755 RepID=A0ABS4J8B1_9BACL|nr:Ldh family oxidoreductase [Paenibacillus eucommiae]MBP1996077.1 LDH2 family malate/lactate/ureidoglycolate dehydrogenase [Paenibacillus eucommiae]
MNTELKEPIKADPERMKNFVFILAHKAGLPEDKALFLAELLIKNDLRGVFTHGSKQIATYARDMRAGLLNKNPQVSVHNDASSTLVVDGDGGLGYFAAYKATQELIERARLNGIAAAVTRNHGHIGAAGIYTRLLVENDLFGYVTSGHQLNIGPENSIADAAGGPPMSFAVPSDEELPMVLDFGATQDLYTGAPRAEELFKLAPGLVFRNLGLGYMCQALGGFLAGVPLDEERAGKQYRGADQGSLIIAMDINRFFPIDQFKGEMDNYMKVTSQMKPMPGLQKATLPGVLEAHREQDWSVSGIPLNAEHQDILASVAAEFGVELPF